MDPKGTTTCRAKLGLAAVAVITASAVGCASSDDRSSRVPDVTPAEAYAAIVRWEITERPPVTDDTGKAELPVVYLAADSGGTVGIGVQAEVVEVTADEAIVRFSDDSTDSLNEGLPGMPVIDDGVMFVVGDVEPGAAGPAIIQTVVRRYRSVDDDETLRFEIVASDNGGIVTSSTQLNNSLD